MELSLLPISSIHLSQLLASVIFLFYFGRAVYRHSFSSISDIPAPNIVASVSIWWQAWHAIKGDTHTILVDLHKAKGTFVRVSHKEVAVCHPEAIPVLLKKALPKVSGRVRRTWSFCDAAKLTIVGRHHGTVSLQFQTRLIKIKCRRPILLVISVSRRI